jgi:hypothetical protein
MRPVETNNRELFNIWDNNQLLHQDYQKDNYKIIQYDNGSNICILFCSSNAIYFPNIKDVYIRNIRVKDRYEWEKTANSKVIRKNVRKIIFIRDIYKQWYVTGINERMHTIDLVVEFLQKETKDYRLITVGSSAGGYAAVLLGVLFNAEKIVTISGQFTVYPFLEKEPFLRKYQNDDTRKKYYNLEKLVSVYGGGAYHLFISNQE